MFELLEFEGFGKFLESSLDCVLQCFAFQEVSRYVADLFHGGISYVHSVIILGNICDSLITAVKSCRSEKCWSKVTVKS